MSREVLYYVVKKLAHVFSFEEVYRVMDILGKIGGEHSKELELFSVLKDVRAKIF